MVDNSVAKMENLYLYSFTSQLNLNNLINLSHAKNNDVNKLLLLLKLKLTQSLESAITHETSGGLSPLMLND